MNVDSPLCGLVLVDLPADVTVPAVGLARPLGERAAIIARIVELLPGTTFSKDGHGSFKRGSYQVERGPGHLRRLIWMPAGTISSDRPSRRQSKWRG